MKRRHSSLYSASRCRWITRADDTVLQPERPATNLELLKSHGSLKRMETCDALRKTTTPGHSPECTASQTETAADYDSWCYTHSHTLRRVRQRKEHSRIIAAVQRWSGNALLLLWFYWLQAWNIILPSLIVTQRPTGPQITHITTLTMPKIMPIRSWL